MGRAWAHPEGKMALYGVAQVYKVKKWYTRMDFVCISGRDARLYAGWCYAVR